LDFSRNWLTKKVFSKIDLKSAYWQLPLHKDSSKDVRSFLGLANFYRRFVPKFADIAAPLTELTESKIVFKWEEQHEKAFTALKQTLSSPPVIAYPKHGDTFTLHLM